ncbi:hypothetical protein J6590_084415, partial [Homalodisca vitripennis]
HDGECCPDLRQRLRSIHCSRLPVTDPKQFVITTERHSDLQTSASYGISRVVRETVLFTRPARTITGQEYQLMIHTTSPQYFVLLTDEGVWSSFSDNYWIRGSLHFFQEYTTEIVLENLDRRCLHPPYTS